MPRPRWPARAASALATGSPTCPVAPVTMILAFSARAHLPMPTRQPQHGGRLRPPAARCRRHVSNVGPCPSCPGCCACGVTVGRANRWAPGSEGAVRRESAGRPLGRRRMGRQPGTTLSARFGQAATASAHCAGSSVGYRRPAREACDGITPIVGLEQLRQQLHAQPAPVAGGPVEVQLAGFCVGVAVEPLIAALLPRSRLRGGRAMSFENVSSALRASRTVPSGW